MRAEGVSDPDPTPPSAAGRARRAAWRAACCVGRAARRYLRDQDGVRAAAIAYFGILSFFPFALLLAAVSSIVAGRDPEAERACLDSLKAFAPFLQDGFWSGVHAMVEGRGVLSGASFLLLWLVASQVQEAIARALGDIFRAGQRPRTWAARHVLARIEAQVFTLGAILLVGALFVARSVLGHLQGMGVEGAEEIAGLLDQPVVSARLVPAVTVGLVAFVLFRRVPGTTVRVRCAATGAALFTLGHEIALTAQGLLQGSAVASVRSFYGPFVSLAVLAIWAYWLAAFLLFCAEVVADLNGNRRD